MQRNADQGFVYTSFSDKRVQKDLQLQAQKRVNMQECSTKLKIQSYFKRKLQLVVLISILLKLGYKCEIRVCI